MVWQVIGAVAGVMTVIGTAILASIRLKQYRDKQPTPRLGKINKAMWYPDGRTGETLCCEVNFEIENTGEVDTTVTYVTLLFPGSPRWVPKRLYYRFKDYHTLPLQTDSIELSAKGVVEINSWEYFDDPDDGTFEPREDKLATVYIETVDGGTYDDLDVLIFDPG